MHHRYQLISRLEERPLSELFIAQKVAEPSQKFLVKLFLQRFSAPEFGQSLQLESAQQVADIGCPHLLAYEEIGFIEGRLTAVRPYIDGYALDDVIRRLYSKEVVLTAPLALYLVAEAARIVAQAHAKGITHGALDSSNLLLGFDGILRVSGFGMMRAVGNSAAFKSIAPKLHRSFRAPEQRAPCLASAVGDVYALGCVAYELLTLQSVAEIRGGGLSTKRDTLQPPSRLNRRINARIDPIIMRSLEVMPTRRYQNAGQFAEALQSLFALLGTAVGPQALARFSREVFPNEVSLTGGSTAAALPFGGPFSLQPLNGESSPSTASPLVAPQIASPALSSPLPGPSGAPGAAPPPLPDTAISTEEVLPAPIAEMRSQIAEDQPAAPPSDAIDASELGATEQRLFDVAFGRDSNQTGRSAHRFVPSEDSEGEEACRRATKRAQPLPAAVVTEDAAGLQASSALPSQAETSVAPGGEAIDQTSPMPQFSQPPPQASALNEVPLASETDDCALALPSADPLASWEAPAGPMPKLVRRVSLGEVRLEDGTSALPASTPDVGVEHRAGSRRATAPTQKPVTRPEVPVASFDGPPTAETPLVQLPLAIPLPAASSEAAPAEGQPPVRPGESGEGSWNAFAMPSKPPRSTRKQGAAAAVFPLTQGEHGGVEEEADWHVRPQLPALAGRPRAHRWRRQWTFAFACALCLACVVIVAFLKREPTAAKLPGEAIQKLSEVLEHKAMPAYLTLETNVPAMVIINGKKSPLDAPFERMELPPGRHIVRLVRGDQVREFGLFLEEGQHERRMENFTAMSPDERNAVSPATPRPRSPQKKTSGR